ncbi:hypothetical protein [Niastella populi]|uniref:Uncharacterized protein n=1 Tax=Niastella populi TaxID=550983 RepID=A0A1V9FJ38_9BACT|nr:hypothetical protein [Niastella populi]OQP58350.1 hypothetical protein A4R26_02470 [Niastella populi]
MNTKILRVVAAVIALIYVAIQTFQWYVFEQFNPPASAAEELQQGNHPLHLVRSSLMLAAMFMLLYVRYVICFIAGMYNRFWANLAFICYFTFFMLEVLLRSTELFYLQLHLPQKARGADAHELKGIIDQFQTFQTIQSALYFPLIVSATISYAILFFLFWSVKQKVNLIIKAVLAIDLLRSFWRLSGDYFNVQWLQGDLYSTIYLPMVIITFGPISIWLLKFKDGYQNTSLTSRSDHF